MSGFSGTLQGSRTKIRLKCKSTCIDSYLWISRLNRYIYTRPIITQHASMTQLQRFELNKTWSKWIRGSKINIIQQLLSDSHKAFDIF
jgi:hypothetical protein